MIYYQGDSQQYSRNVIKVPNNVCKWCQIRLLYEENSEVTIFGKQGKVVKKGYK